MVTVVSKPRGGGGGALPWGHSLGPVSDWGLPRCARPASQPTTTHTHKPRISKNPWQNSGYAELPQSLQLEKRHSRESRPKKKLVTQAGWWLGLPGSGQVAALMGYVEGFVSWINIHSIPHRKKVWSLAGEVWVEKVGVHSGVMAVEGQTIHHPSTPGTTRDGERCGMCVKYHVPEGEGGYLPVWLPRSVKSYRWEVRNPFTCKACKASQRITL